MPTLEFTRADIQRLQHERFQHPHPRVQRKMEAVYLTSQGLSRATVCRLTQLSRGMLATYVRQSRTGGVARLQAVNFYRPQSAFLAHQATIEAPFAAHPPATINQARTTLKQVDRHSARAHASAAVFAAWRLALSQGREPAGQSRSGRASPISR